MSDAVHAAFAAARVPASNRGMPRLTALVTQPWGLREAALVDMTATCFGWEYFADCTAEKNL